MKEVAHDLFNQEPSTEISMNQSKTTESLNSDKKKKGTLLDDFNLRI